VEFVEPARAKRYLELYHRLDVVLDPFRTMAHDDLDALWMGVPVVSLAGERSVSRAGLSQLPNLGCELVPFSRNEYAESPRYWLTISRASRECGGAARADGSLRADGCGALRARHRSAYRTMWRQWCKQEDISAR